MSLKKPNKVELDFCDHQGRFKFRCNYGLLLNMSQILIKEQVDQVIDAVKDDRHFVNVGDFTVVIREEQ